MVDGRLCERWVLSDWYHRGQYLRATANGCEPVEWPFEQDSVKRFAMNLQLALIHRAFLPLFLALLGGCTLFERNELKATDQTAVVRGADWGKVYRGGYVQIVSVTGKSPAWGSSDQTAVPPGPQTGEFLVLLCQTERMGCQPLARNHVRPSVPKPDTRTACGRRRRSTAATSFSLGGGRQDSRAGRRRNAVAARSSAAVG